MPQEPRFDDTIIRLQMKPKIWDPGFPGYNRIFDRIHPTRRYGHLQSLIIFCLICYYVRSWIAVSFILRVMIRGCVFVDNVYASIPCVYVDQAV